jgi:mono/diheme cytochrome c family protein
MPTAPPSAHAAPHRRRSRRGWFAGLGAVLVFLLITGSLLTWEKFFRTAPQDMQPGAAAFSPADMRFAYGSLGGEQLGGIPYPIFMVLPRVFPDLVQKYAAQGYGPEKRTWGGYGAFGFAWEQGQRLPVGLSIRRAGYERVTGNCALCHTATWRLSPNDDEHIVLGGPAHTANLQALARFLFACAHDDRFTPERLVPEIALHFPLDAADKVLLSTVIVPETRAELLLAGRELAFMNAKTPWGPGRDDAFNLPKFLLAQEPWDASVSNTDFPAVWKLADRDGGLLHAGGEARDLYSVIATSALGTGSIPNSPAREDEAKWLAAYIRAKAPPAFPGAVDAGLAARGRALFQAGCAQCHAPGGARTGQAIPLTEVATDPEHVLAFTAHDADRTNFAGAALGFRKARLQAPTGYVAKPLVGVWLLGPYLHNGAVPTIADLLAPPAQRPQVFWRGYDVLDAERLGFRATDPQAQASGFRFDTRLKGNGSGGHLYGTTLPDADKRALIEYLKTL